MSGNLYLVSLPIGNLDDVTYRAIEVLKAADFILAEDTRITRRILRRHNVDTPLFSSLYQGVEHQRVRSILALLHDGRNLALVSDAGTPLINDPGYSLVRAAIDGGHNVIPVPGPSAALAAVVASGLPTDRFCFEGSVPRKPGSRRAFFERIRNEARTTIAYESPRRLTSTLQIIADIFPDRRLVLAREMTKVHEEFLRGTAGSILDALRSRQEIRGECVLVIEGASEPPAPYDREAANRLLSTLVQEGVSKRGILRALTSALGIPRNEAYALIHGKGKEKTD